MSKSPFELGHSPRVPDGFGKGLNAAVAVCACGAEWNAFYSKHGLVWRPRGPEATKVCPRAVRPQGTGREKHR